MSAGEIGRFEEEGDQPLARGLVDEESGGRVSAGGHGRPGSGGSVRRLPDRRGQLLNVMRRTH